MENKPATARDIERRLMEKRVDSLERMNRRLVAGMILIVVAFAAVLAWGWNELRPKRIISAEEFRVLDRAGRARAWLTLNADNDNAELAIFDGKSESPRLLMGAPGQKGPYMHIKDTEGKTRLSLSVDESGPRIGLADPEDKERLSVRLATGRPALVMNDPEGKQRAELFLDGGGPGLSFGFGKDANVLEMYGLRSGPVILMKDDQGNHLWAAPK